MAKVKISRILWLPIGYKVDKESGYLAITFLGLDIRICWRTEYWDWGFTVGTNYRGICFERTIGFWFYRESLKDFWLD